MAHAQRCPICNGKGKIFEGNFITTTIGETCRGCNGRGWVEVQDYPSQY